jgi:hypothetical protein
MSENDESIKKKEDLLKNWLTGLRTLNKGNFVAATYFQKVHRVFGVPVMIATSVVGSAIFATLGKSGESAIQISAGIMSLAATVLSSLQTFLGYAERSSQHKSAAVKYGEVRTEVQWLLAHDLQKVADLDKKIETIRARWNNVDAEAPTLPKWIIEETEAEVSPHS